LTVLALGAKDTGVGDFDLRYLKNKEKHEIDFLLLHNKKVFLPIEVKLSDEQPSTSWGKFMPDLHCAFGVQLVIKSNVYKVHEYKNYKVLVMSAADFLGLYPPFAIAIVRFLKSSSGITPIFTISYIINYFAEELGCHFDQQIR
jgi:hypothetical protein